MAKSLRASSKVKARNARRYTPGNDYTVIHAARLNAVSQRLASRMKAQDKDKTGAVVDLKKKGKAAEDGTQADVASDDEDEQLQATMDVEDATTKDDASPSTDAATPAKVSTSGTRGSRRETWRKARGWKAKTGSKNGGKPKRRR